MLEHFPDASTVCSAVTARQLNGFGFNAKLIVKAPGEYLDLGGYQFQFISYPSVVHLWEGLLALESMRGNFAESIRPLRSAGTRSMLAIEALVMRAN